MNSPYTTERCEDGLFVQIRLAAQDRKHGFFVNVRLNKCVNSSSNNEIRLLG